MLQLPTVLLFFILVLSGATVAGLTTYFFRKYVKLKILKSHNIVTGNFFLVIGSFYALLLSFVVFVVWNQLNDTNENVSKEGSSALALYNDIKFYPDTTESKELMAYYLDFANNIINDEFPNMRQMKLSRKTPEALNNVYYAVERLNPKTPYETQLAGQMFDHLNELSNYRGLRTSSIETEIPPFMWLPIVLGAIIVIISGLFLDIEHVKIHIGLNFLLGAFLGLLFFIIILLDHPYTANDGIEPKSYKQIFVLEKWSNEALVYSKPLIDTLQQQSDTIQLKELL